MSIVRQKDRKTGIVYVYEQKSVWIPELKQFRARRQLIGKVDPETGETIPTGKVGRPRKRVENLSSSETASSPVSNSDLDKSDKEVVSLRETIAELESQISVLRLENERLVKRIQQAVSILTLS